MQTGFLRSTILFDIALYHIHIYDTVEITEPRYLLAKRRRAKEKDQSIVRQTGAVHKADT